VRKPTFLLESLVYFFFSFFFFLFADVEQQQQQGEQRPSEVFWHHISEAKGEIEPVFVFAFSFLFVFVVVRFVHWKTTGNWWNVFPLLCFEWTVFCDYDERQWTCIYVV
jgi:hypothetical protein